MKQTLPVMPMTTHHKLQVISIKNDSIKLFKWFADNQMKANKDKCHLLISGSENITINVDENIIEKNT